MFSQGGPSYKVSRSSKGTATGSSGAESLYQSVDELEGKNTGNRMNESVLASFCKFEQKSM